MTKDQLIADAASLGCAFKALHTLQTHPSYKALCAADKADVDHTYYEAVKYQQQWDEEEYQASRTIGNLDLIA